MEVRKRGVCGVTWFEVVGAPSSRPLLILIRLGPATIVSFNDVNWIDSNGIGAVSFKWRDGRGSYLSSDPNIMRSPSCSGIPWSWSIETGNWFNRTSLGSSKLSEEESADSWSEWIGFASDPDLAEQSAGPLALSCGTSRLALRLRLPTAPDLPTPATN